MTSMKTHAPLEQTPVAAKLLAHINSLAAREGAVSAKIVELEKNSAAGAPNEHSRLVAGHLSRALNGFAAPKPEPAREGSPEDLANLRAEAEAIVCAKWQLNRKLMLALNDAAEERGRQMAASWAVGAKAFCIAVIRAQALEAAAYEFLESTGLTGAPLGQIFPIRGFLAPSHFLQYGEDLIRELTDVALESGLVTKADIENERRAARKCFGL